MSALEQEIIERLKHLSETAKLHILEVVKREEYEISDNADGFVEGNLADEEWWQQILALRQDLATTAGDVKFPSAADMVRELRDEKS